MMAEHISTESITLKAACEADSPLSPSDPGIQDSNRSLDLAKARARKRKFVLRGFGSRKLLIIIALTFIVTSSIHFPRITLEYISGEHAISIWVAQFNNVIYYTAFAISCPVASLLAEVVVGRYKLVSWTLRALWTVSLTGSVIAILFECCLSTASSVFYMVTHYLVAIPNAALWGAFTAIVIPLGIDQIADGSSNNISSFIVWFLWVMFSAYGVTDILAPVFYKCLYFLKEDETIVVMSLVPVIFLSVGLVIDFTFGHKLTKEPVSVNPVSLIYKVLKYAAKHKYPVQRSAFTYCENKRLTRLDFGKSKYGGPFTTEQVEDVKTFWRVMLIVLVISMLYIPFNAVYNSNMNFESQFHLTTSSHCTEAVFKGATTPSSLIAYTIPLYELLIYPCLRSRSLGILKSAGLGAGAVTLSALYGTVADAARQIEGMRSNATIECMFSLHSPTVIQGAQIVPLLFNSLLGLSVILTYKSNVEFVCAQAPYNMTGFLIGLSFSLQTIFRAFGAIFFIAWNYGWFEVLKTPFCGVWYYLAAFVTTLAISLLLILAVRWYKARERDEIQHSQVLVEDIYYKYNKNSSSDRH